MTHDELRAFQLYDNATAESQAACRQLVNHVQTRYGLRPFETPNHYIQWDPNFALIQTLGVHELILTINLTGAPDGYAGMGIEDMMRPPRRGMTRVRLDDAARLPQLISAVDRSHALRMERDER